MSEDKASYNYAYNNKQITSIKQFSKLDCCKHFCERGYKPPTAEDIKTLMQLAGWTNNQTAQLLDLHYTPQKGAPTLGRWRASEASKNRKQIPNSTWRLLLIYAGVIKDPQGDLKYVID